MRPRQDGRHFPANIFKCIFLNENVKISIKILLKFVPMGPTNNIPALVQIMAWRRPGDTPLYEPMMVSLLTHICVTRPQWVKISLKFVPKGPINSIPALVQIMAWCWPGDKPLSEPMIVSLLMHMGQVTELWLSSYLVLLSVDSKTRWQGSHSFVSWPIYASVGLHELMANLTFICYKAVNLFQITDDRQTACQWLEGMRSVL